MKNRGEGKKEEKWKIGCPFNSREKSDTKLFPKGRLKLMSHGYQVARLTRILASSELL